MRCENTAFGDVNAVATEKNAIPTEIEIEIERYLDVLGEEVVPRRGA
jgi:hypothetical protein